MASRPSPHYYYNFRHEKKAVFLAAFRENGNIKMSANIAEIDRTAVYKWLEHDPEFLTAFGLAKKDAVESLEAEAHRRATEGVRKEKPIFYEGREVGMVIETEYSDTLLIFLLKGAAPEKYRENIAVTQTQVIKAIDSEAYEAV
jgi:hypothetical protein